MIVLDWNTITNMSPLIIAGFVLLGWVIRNTLTISRNASDAVQYAAIANHNSTKVSKQLTLLKDALLSSGTIKLETVMDWDKED